MRIRVQRAFQFPKTEDSQHVFAEGLDLEDVIFELKEARSG